MAGSDIRAGRATTELTTKDLLAKGLARAKYRLRAFSRDVQQLGTGMVGAATGLLAPVGAALKVFSEIGDNAAKMARRTGVSVEAIQALGFAAERAGTDSKALEMGLRRMQRSIYDAGRGLSTQTDALKDLGLSYQDLAGRKPEEQFKTLAGALSRVDDASRRAALAQAVFGRSGTMLLPMFEDGEEGLDRMIERFEDLGVTLSAADTKAAEAFTDTMTDLWTAVKYGVALLGSALEPAIRDMVGSAQAWLKEAAAWIRRNRDLIVQYGHFALTVGKWLAIVGGGLVVVGKLAGGLSALVGIVKGVSTAFAALAAGSPLGWAALGVGAVVALGVALSRLASYTADLHHEQRDALDTADRQRAADLARLKRLRELAGQNRLNEAQMAEAARLAEELNGRYEGLGIAVNKTTGKIEGLAGAFRKVADAQRAAAESQIIAALAATRQNVREINKELRSQGDVFASPFQVAGAALGMDVPEEVRSLIRQREGATKDIEALQSRLEALRSGKAGAVTGGAAAGIPAGGAAGAGTAGAAGRAAEAAAKAGADEEKRQLDRLVRLKIQAHQDAHERELAGIRQRYAEERDRLEASGASAKAIHRMMLAQDEELAAARRKHQQEIFDEAGREADAWYAAQVAAAEEEQGIRDQIAREQVSAMEEGPLKELARLDLEREIARGQAATEGQARMIDRLYGLRAQAVAKADSFKPDVDTSGTFSAFFARMFAGRAAGGDPAARAAEETAEHTAAIERQLRQGLTVNPVGYGN